jgi:hypothetical protein
MFSWALPSGQLGGLAGAFYSFAIRSKKAIRDYNIVFPDQRTRPVTGLAAARPLPKTMPHKRRKAFYQDA